MDEVKIHIAGPDGVRGVRAHVKEYVDCFVGDWGVSVLDAREGPRVEVQDKGCWLICWLWFDFVWVDADE